jgi:hypothetical protein
VTLRPSPTKGDEWEIQWIKDVEAENVSEALRLAHESIQSSVRPNFTEAIVVQLAG